VSHNRLDVIRTHTFDGLHRLREVRLGHNRLRAIEDRGLAVGRSPLQTRLTWLYLDHNQLDRLTQPMFAGMSHLKFLSAGNNQIINVEVDAFQPVPRLVTLLLQNNRIRRLESGVFKALKGLRHLNIASNHIHVLQGDVFHGLDRVGDINVDDNELVEVDHQAFNATPRLEMFSARGNQLRVADLRVLDCAQRLRSLELAENLISEVIFPEKDDAGFSPFRGLSLLSLSDNSLRALDEKVLNALRRDGALMRVHGNPWYCNCRLNWLMMLVTGQSQHHVDRPSSVVCSSPPYLADRKVSRQLLV